MARRSQGPKRCSGSPEGAQPGSPPCPGVRPPAHAASPSTQGSFVTLWTIRGGCSRLWHRPSPPHGRPWASCQMLGAAWSSCRLPGCPICQACFINILCLPGCKIPMRDGGRGGRGASSPSAAGPGSFVKEAILGSPASLRLVPSAPSCCAMVHGAVCGKQERMEGLKPGFASHGGAVSWTWMVAGLDHMRWPTPETPACAGTLLLAASMQRDGSCPFMQRCARRSAMQHSPTHTVLPLALPQKETHSMTPP